MKKSILFALLAVVLGSSFISPAGKLGSDVVEIYLNNKMIVQQAVNKPVELKNLPISEANLNDKLVVFFKSCHVPGLVEKKRSIIIRDESGKVVKEWVFDHAGEKSGAMSIAVRDVLGLMKGAEGLTLVYKGSNYAGVTKS